MHTANTILLASHGSEGARAAEQMALNMCNKGGLVHHLLVVPGFWRDMTGDDWLNNGVTRNRFRNYLEDQLSEEVAEHQARISQATAKRALNYTCEVIIGEPTDCLVKVTQQNQYDLVIMGSPRPKGKSGLRSRMLTESTHNLATPVMVVPYPDE